MGKLWTKYENMNVQVKAAIWFTLCSILQKGISFITVPIFTRLLTTEQYGTYSLYLSWLQILTIVTSLYLYHGVFNNGMTKFDKDRDVYISSMQGITITITTGMFAIYLIAYRWWSEVLGLAPVLMIFMFIEMWVTPALSFWSGRQRFDVKYKKLVAITLSKSIFNPVLGLLAVSLANDKSTARIASVVLTEVIFCGTIMIRQFIKGKCFVNLKYWKYALSLAIPLLPHYLSSMILNQGDRIMISRVIGTSEVAFYSVAYNIGMLVQIFTSALNHSFTPWMYKRIKSNDCKNMRGTVNFLLIIVGIMAFCLMMLSPELVMIFGSSDYTSAVYVIPPIAASVFFIFLYNILAIPQFYFEKTKFLMFSSITAAIVNVGLNYIFIRQYGYIAAAYTTLICYVMYSLGHYLISNRVIKNNFPSGDLFDVKFILGLSILVIITGICCNLLFGYWYLRYLVLIICLLFIFVKRKLIIELLIGLKR